MTEPKTFVRRSSERGHANHGWLDSHHTFSFANYYDPRFMGFRALRVINEDRVVPGAGFPTHPHRDMEIISCVLDGAIEHKDSMCNGSVIRPGDVQRMTAGTGVTHSEYNPSKTDGLHFLQIWIEPSAKDLEPGYEQKAFPEAERRGRLRLVASPDGAENSVTIHQDARLYSGLLQPNTPVRFETRPERHTWLQVIAGDVHVFGESLSAGDAMAVTEADVLEIQAQSEAHVLLFDLA